MAEVDVEEHAVMFACWTDLRKVCSGMIRHLEHHFEE